MLSSELTEEQRIALLEYRQWSEDYWAAGFMSPDEETVRRFMKWKFGPPELPFEGPLTNYEEEFLERYAALLPEYDNGG